MVLPSWYPVIANVPLSVKEAVLAPVGMKLMVAKSDKRRLSAVTFGTELAWPPRAEGARVNCGRALAGGAIAAHASPNAIVECVKSFISRPAVSTRVIGA